LARSTSAQFSYAVPTDGRAGDRSRFGNLSFVLAFSCDRERTKLGPPIVSALRMLFLSCKPYDMQMIAPPKKRIRANVLETFASFAVDDPPERSVCIREIRGFFTFLVFE
jgi:hypothetical protein